MRVGGTLRPARILSMNGRTSDGLSGPPKPIRTTFASWVTGELSTDKKTWGLIGPVSIAQSLMGGLTILLTGILAGRFAPPATSRRASIVAASLASFAPPLVLADLTLMSESLAAFLIAAFLAAAGRPGAPGWPL